MHPRVWLLWISCTIWSDAFRRRDSELVIALPSVRWPMEFSPWGIAKPVDTPLDPVISSRNSAQIYPTIPSKIFGLDVALVRCVVGFGFLVWQVWD